MTQAEPSRRAARSSGSRTLRAAYAILVLACFLAGFSLGLTGIFAATWAEPRKTGVTGVVGMLGVINGLGMSFAPYRIAFIGDSTTMAYPDDRKVADRLQQLLGEGRRRSVQVFDLATPGLGTHDYYFVAGEIARNRPSLLVISVNLTSFSESFIQRFKRPAFAALLLPSQIPEALSLPIQHIGLTADRVFFYVGLTSHERIFNAWRWLTRRQSEVQGTHQDLVARVDEALGNTATADFRKAQRWNGLRESQVEGNRFGARGTRAAYDVALDGEVEGHDALIMLRAAIQTMTDAGVPTLAYVGPINREHMATIGVLNEEGIRESVQAIRKTVQDAGAEFVDLHDLLPDAGFVDGAGHYAIDPLDGPLLVAEKLAPHIARMLQLAEAKH